MKVYSYTKVGPTRVFTELGIGETMWSEVPLDTFGLHAVWKGEAHRKCPKWLLAAIACYKLGGLPKEFICLGPSTGMPYFKEVKKEDE